MAGTNQIKVTIGGKETTPGTAVSRTAVLPISGMPTVTKKPNKAVDPAIVGANMDAGQYLLSYDVSGNIPLAIRPVPGIGMMLNSLQGDEETPVQVGACIRLMYTGSEASCKIEPDASAGAETLDSSIGDKGSETGDTNFGTAGSIDLTDTSFDTVGELMTAINGYSDYSCEKVFGDDDVDCGDILQFTSPGNTRQGKNTWVYIWFGSTDSGVYKHEFPSYLADASERDTYSVQIDGMLDDYLYDGIVADALSLEAAAEGFVSGSVDVLGFDEETDGVTASSLDIEEVDPLVFGDGSFFLGSNEYSNITNHSLKVSNNHRAKCFGQGTLGRLYHKKGKYDVEGDCQVRGDATSIAERAKVFSGANVAVSFYYTGGDLVASTGAGDAGIPEFMLVELPYCEVSMFDTPDNDGIIDAKIGFKATKPHGTLYNDPVTITILTTDPGAYS